MKIVILVILTLTCNSTFLLAQEQKQASSEELQKWIMLEKEETRAKHGDNVLIVITTVKDEAKKEHDQWIQDVLYKALYASKSDMKKAQLKVTRWLEPTKQNADGTWSYSWIMDPMIPNTNYDIQPFLKNEYGEKEAKIHWQKYLSFMAAPPKDYIMKQTKK